MEDTLFRHSDTATGVQQSIKTISGSKYGLSFKVGNADAPSGNIGTSSTVNALLNGKKYFHATNTKGKGKTHQVWESFSTTFTAKSQKTTLAFVNGDPTSDTDNGLDCVRVVALQGSALHRLAKRAFPSSLFSGPRASPGSLTGQGLSRRIR
jgi:hypothetical protein